MFVAVDVAVAPLMLLLLVEDVVRHDSRRLVATAESVSSNAVASDMGMGEDSFGRNGMAW